MGEREHRHRESDLQKIHIISKGGRSVLQCSQAQKHLRKGSGDHLQPNRAHIRWKRRDERVPSGVLAKVSLHRQRNLHAYRGLKVNDRQLRSD